LDRIDDGIGDEGCGMVSEALKCNSALTSLYMWSEEEREEAKITISL